MENNTHSAHIIGTGINVFIDGIPDKCDHKWDGEGANLVTDRETGRESYVLDSVVQKFPGATHAEKYHNWMDSLKAENKWCNGGACTCSKCGKVFEPDFFGMP